MLFITANGADITTKVDRNSVRITEQLNNRSNTANFSVVDQVVSEGQTVEVWEYTTLRNTANSGQPVLDVNDTFGINNKFRAGNYIRLDFDNVKKRYTILSVDTTNRQITLTTNLATTYGVTTKLGQKRFAGIVQTASESEFTAGPCTGIFERDISVSDFKHLFDRQNVADTYTNMYLREMISRVVYFFCANDTERTVVTFDAIGTNTGVAGTPTLNTSDRIEGTASVQFGMSGAGTGTANRSFASVDLSVYEKLRFWRKAKKTYGKYITSFTVRIGTNTSNYFEYAVANFGELFEDCRSMESLTLLDPINTVGTPSLTNITNIYFVFGVTASLPSDGIILDHCQAFTGGFTLQKFMRGYVKYEDVRVQYEKPSAFVEKMTKLGLEYRSVDYDRDLHYYSKLGDTNAPFSITETSTNFGDMEVNADISTLKNRVVVRGGEAPEVNDYTQEEVVDGKQTSYNLDYKPKDFRIYVDTTGTGSSYVQKTTGIENLVDPTTVDFVFNFQEKVVRNGASGVLASGTLVKMIYKPYKPIRVIASDPTSIAKMKLLTKGNGVYEGAIVVDAGIRSYQEARQRATAEIDAYKNPIVTITFHTNYDGLAVGQLLHIQDSDRGINDDYLIQKISRRSKSNDYRDYTVTASSTLFGITEFLQLLLKQRDKFEFDVTELVDVIEPMDETIQITEAYNLSKAQTTFRAGVVNQKGYDFVFETGSISAIGYLGPQRYVNYVSGQTGTVSFNTGDRHNNGKSLQIVNTNLGSGLKTQVYNFKRRPMPGGISHRLRGRLQILTALAGTTGVSVYLREYANATTASILQTTTLFSGIKAVQDYTMYEANFTSHASTTVYDLLFEFENSTGTVNIADLFLTQNTVDGTTNPAIADFSQVI